MRINILFGDLEVYDGKKKVIVKNAVFTEGAQVYKKMNIIKIHSFKIVGQTHIIKDYTTVKKSNEARNKTTGAYE
jgi:hypothetical protein